MADSARGLGLLAGLPLRKVCVCFRASAWHSSRYKGPFLGTTAGPTCGAEPVRERSRRRARVTRCAPGGRVVALTGPASPLVARRIARRNKLAVRSTCRDATRFRGYVGPSFGCRLAPRQCDNNRARELSSPLAARGSGGLLLCRPRGREPRCRAPCNVFGLFGQTGGPRCSTKTRFFGSIGEAMGGLRHTTADAEPHLRRARPRSHSPCDAAEAGRVVRRDRQTPRPGESPSAGRSVRGQGGRLVAPIYESGAGAASMESTFRPTGRWPVWVRECSSGGVAFTGTVGALPTA